MMKTPKKALVTGGAGYIGSRLVAKLIDTGFSVAVIDNMATGSKTNVPSNTVFYKVDIRSEKIAKIVQKEKPDIIFHFAALKDITESLKNPIAFTDVNILGSLNVLDAAHKAGVKKFVFTSTAAVYGETLVGGFQSEKQPPNPLSPYGASKLAIEEYMNYYNKVHGMQGIVLRFANVYGPGGFMPYNGVINTFIKNALQNKELIIHGDGKQTRDFVCTDDIVDLCLQLALSNYHALTLDQFIFNVSTGKEVSIRNVADILKNYTQKPLRIIYKKNLSPGQKRSILSPKLAEDILGWSSKISLEKGIALTVAYYVSNQKTKNLSSANDTKGKTNHG